MCRRFIASRHVLKPGLRTDTEENVNTIVLEDGWICLTCTLQNLASQAWYTACLGRRATNLVKHGRLLSCGKSLHRRFFDRKWRP